MEIDYLIKIFERRLNTVPTAIHRYIYNEIDWRNRLIAIKGQRGCGKTTLLLQYIKEHFANTGKALYVSLDDIWFANHDLLDLVEYLYTHGFTHLFIDEIHYNKDWKQLIKNIYDNYSDMNIVYTGSSMLEIENSRIDLSRRQIIYEMQGLSFREYLAFEGVANLPAITLSELLSNHQNIARKIIDRYKILPLFEDYLRRGYYPFYMDSPSGYDYRLREIVRLIIEQDYPHVDNITLSTINKTKKMLMVLAQATPQKVNMSRLYSELGCDRNQGMRMLNALSKGGLLNLLSAKINSLKSLSRPDKIYLNNTNLMYALVENIDTGTLRETFLLNQLCHRHSVIYPPQGDFLIDNKYLIEVGGPNKKFNQIKDLSDSYLAIGDLDVGYGNRIPLWMFGLLY